MYHLPFSFIYIYIVFEAGEAFDEEEDHIKRVVNFSIHTFSDLAMPARLF